MSQPVRSVGAQLSPGAAALLLGESAAAIAAMEHEGEHQRHHQGSLLHWRNVTDTSGSGTDSSRLNPQSGKGYKVFKGDLDILHPNPEPGRQPYSFKVEIQIYTLEGFLRTVHGSHSASHMALKLRQFLYGLVPRLFPRDIYGQDWISLG